MYTAFVMGFYLAFAALFCLACAAFERFVMPHCHHLNAWLESFED